MSAQPQLAATGPGPGRVTLGLICLWTMLVGASVVGKRPNACMVPQAAGAGAACSVGCASPTAENYAWLPATGGGSSGPAGSAQPAAGGPEPPPQTSLEPLGSQVDERLGQGVIAP
jgi:hypothetical protein